MTSIQIGSIELAEFLDESTAWTGFYFNKLTDWYSLPRSKAVLSGRHQAHGSHRGGFDWRENATPSVEGGYVGVDEVAALAAMNTLKRAWALGSELRMTVNDSLFPSWRNVSVRFVTIPDHHGRHRFEFAIDAIAADPLRYGTEIAVSTGLPVSGGGLTWPITWPLTWGGGGSAGRVILDNPGSADTRPRLIEVPGGLSDGFTIDEVGTNRQVRLDRLVPLGSTIFLNPRTGRAYIDAPGNDVSRYLSRSEWPTIPAGGQSTLQFNKLGTSSGDPTMTVRYSRADW